MRDIYLLVIVQQYLRGFSCFQCLNVFVVYGYAATDPYQQVGINDTYGAFQVLANGNDFFGFTTNDVGVISVGFQIKDFFNLYFRVFTPACFQDNICFYHK